MREFTSILAVILSMSAAPVRADGDGEQVNAGQVDTSRQATRGIHRLELASPLPRGSLVLSAASEYFTASSFIAKGDTHSRLAWHGFIAASPISPLDLAISWSSVSNKNDPALSDPTQTLGDPTFAAKLSFAVTRKLGLGLATSFLVPTSPDGTGLQPKAFTLTTKAVTSFAVSPAFTVALNAGYRLDNSRKIFTKSFTPELAPVLSFNAGMAQENAIVGGLGGIGRIACGEAATLHPFAELTAEMAPGASENPMRATAGAKLVLQKGAPLELAVGGDYRITGKPNQVPAEGEAFKEDNKLAGLPPWEVFARIALHIGFIKPKVQVASGPQTCSSSSTCPSGQSCVDGLCVLVKEQEVIKEVVKEVVKDVPTFILAGRVIDISTKEPVANATVRLSGYEGTTITTDDQGKFKTWPLKVDEGILQMAVDAVGYQKSEQTMAKGPAGETKALEVGLVSASKSLPGKLSGSLKDKRTGKPVKGLVVLPSLNKKLKASNEGTFEAEFAAGRYQVIISCPKYQSQTKEITISPGEVVILNIDMTPKGKR